MGRKAANIDEEQVRALARLDCTWDEIADVLRVSRSTFGKYIKTKKSLREAYERGRSEGDVSLRRAQHEQALKGKTAMLIWLGKNRLNQSDKVEVQEKPSDTAREFYDAIKRIDETITGAGQ